MYAILCRHPHLLEGDRVKSLAAAVLVAAAIPASGALAATPTTAVGNVKTGKSLFKLHDCGSCHLMAAANALDGSGAGPDLDTTRKTYAQIVANITNGGKHMTGYKKVLTTVQIQDLAAFIYKSAQTQQ
jgi:mono/diheme cytochrome c family protein